MGFKVTPKPHSCGAALQGGRGDLPNEGLPSDCPFPFLLGLFFFSLIENQFFGKQNEYFLSRRKPTPVLLPLLFPLPTPAFKHSASPKQSCGCGVGGCVLGLTPSTLPSKLPLLHITLEERNSMKTMQKLEFFAIF